MRLLHLVSEIRQFEHRFQGIHHLFRALGLRHLLDINTFLCLKSIRSELKNGKFELILQLKHKDLDVDPGKLRYKKCAWPEHVAIFYPNHLKQSDWLGGGVTDTFSP